MCEGVRSTRGTHVADGHTQCGEAWHAHIKYSDREVGLDGAEASSLSPWHYSRSREKRLPL